MTPTQRTLEYYKNLGYDCCVVERWIKSFKHPAGGFRKDMFGFGDIIAIKGDETIAIQSCGQAFSGHNKKITLEPYIADMALKWVSGGRRLVLIGWRKLKVKRGGKAMEWMPRIKEYEIKDFKGKASEYNEN